MSDRSFLLALLFALSLAQFSAGCHGSDDPPGSCAADASWVENPAVRAEVPHGGGSSGCDFHRFSWEDFLALVEPDAQGLVFESFLPSTGVFSPSAFDPNRGSEPFPFGSQLPAPPGCPSGSAKMLGLSPFADKADPDLGEDLEAGSNAAPLTDQHGRWLHYGIALNKTAADFLTQCQLYKIGCYNQGVTDANIRFPEQSIVIKTAWIVVDGDVVDRSRFYVTQALVNPLGPTPSEQGCREATVALVGFHIMHKTPKHPEWIWATFEHEDTAPDCQAPSPTSPSGQQWLYHNSQCAGANACTENVYQNPCAQNDCPANDLVSYQCGLELDSTCSEIASCSAQDPCRNCFNSTCAAAAVPSQVCRPFPIGWTLHGGDVPAIDEQYVGMNQSVRAILANNGSVWQHYNHIGTLYCRAPGESAPGGRQCSKQGLLATAQQVGQLQLSNVGMESYNQRLNCFSCHNGSYAPTANAFPQSDFSHLFAHMSAQGACGDDRPDFCPIAAHEGPAP